MPNLLTNIRYATADTVFKKSIIVIVTYKFSYYITHTPLTVTNNTVAIIPFFSICFYSYKNVIMHQLHL